jgi:trehalose utilization protein
MTSLAPRVLVWNEYRHERNEPEVRAIYPDGMHAAIAGGLRRHGLDVRTATLDEPEHGLSEAALAQTDVLVWWGHQAHREVRDDVVERVRLRVLAGMGFIALHSTQDATIFKRLMGSDNTVQWRDDGEKERLWVVAPEHPIAAGLGPSFVLEREEMYGEPFGIPVPDELIFISWFQGGEVIRSGCTFHRGLGRIFYFRPGPESFPTYHDDNVRLVLANACRWAAPNFTVAAPPANARQGALEPIP